MINTTRVHALVVRHLYLYKRSLPRLMDIFYWPMLDLLLWGFITTFFTAFSEKLPGFVTFLVGAMIFWNIMFRSQQGISVSFLEEVWSRNLLNIFISPLTVGEYLIANIIVSLVKVMFAAVVMAASAYIFFGFDIFVIGSSIFALFFNLLMMGWSIGILTTALILYFGEEAEVMAWGFPFIFQPVSAVFYPVSVLPDILQKVAFAVPASHVFEGMRSILNNGGFPMKSMLYALGLNVIYMFLSVRLFFYLFEQSKEKGYLVKRGT